MKDDPIVAEIHRIREQILNACDGDLDKLMDRLKAAEDRDRDRVVSMKMVRQRREGARVSDPA